MAKRKSNAPADVPPEPELPIRVVLFREAGGKVPLLEWFADLDQRAAAKCRVLIGLLEEFGNHLRRPHADYLRDGIFELRARLNKVRYRMLYFFQQRTAVVTHGFAKAGAAVEPHEIDQAVAFRKQFLANPRRHTHAEG